MIRHMDNFSLYTPGSATDLLSSVFASISSQISGTNIWIQNDPVTSGRICNIIAASNTFNWSILKYVLPNNEAVVGVSQRVYLNEIPKFQANFPTLVSFRDSGGNAIGAVRVDTTGRLYLTGSTAPSPWLPDQPQAYVLATTPSPVISAGAWTHIEVKMTTGASGSIIVHVEGAEVLNYTGSFSSGSGIYGLQWMNLGISGTTTKDWYLKDLVIWDGSGSQNNNFIGRVVVYSCVPSADDSLNWTPVGAANGYSVLSTTPYSV